MRSATPRKPGIFIPDDLAESLEALGIKPAAEVPRKTKAVPKWVFHVVIRLLILAVLAAIAYCCGYYL